MTERLFLEDIGRSHSISAIGDARLWSIHNLFNDPTLPPLIYVMESAVGQQFLLGRHVSGRPKFNMVRYIAKSIVGLFFEHLSRKDCCQYLILRDAYPFDLQFAFGCAPPYDIRILPTAFIKLERVPSPDGTDLDVKGQEMIGEYRGETWLIPDLKIGSGSTIAFFLKNAFARHVPREVHLFTTCGSLEGIRRIHKECRKAGVELIPVFTQCIFELSKNGNLPGLPFPNLSVMNPGSITTREFYEKAMTRYQGARMCSVGDVNASLDDPLQYSIQTLWEWEALKMDPQKENWDDWTIDIRGENARNKIREFRPALFDYFKSILGEEPSG